MKQHGELDRGLVAERYVPLQWTEAQKKELVVSAINRVV